MWAIVKAGAPSGSSCIKEDGWHYSYLRMQGNMAAIVFDGYEVDTKFEENPLHTLFKAIPMSYARQVWACGVYWVVVGNEVTPHVTDLPHAEVLGFSLQLKDYL